MGRNMAVGGLENYEGDYALSELDPLIDLLNQFSTISFDGGVSKPLRIFKDVALEDLINIISSDVSVHVINGLCKQIRYRDTILN